MGTGWDYVEGIIEIHIPQFCEKCGGIMIFQGVGEYQCEKCGFTAYDDYGKVRNYLEKRPGATIGEVEMASGVDQRIIRKLLKEGRIMLAEDSKVMLSCEMCGRRIRFGRLCALCEQEVIQEHENARKHKGPHLGMHGYMISKKQSATGQKRFYYDKPKE